MFMLESGSGCPGRCPGIRLNVFILESGSGCPGRCESRGIFCYCPLIESRSTPTNQHHHHHDCDGDDVDDADDDDDDNNDDDADVRANPQQ